MENRLHLIVSPPDLPRFFQLLGAGVILRGPMGISIRQFLVQQAGIDGGYLDGRIQTIFYDGNPVDDVDATFVHSGATLALSAAMPGVLGATMRKGGYYAAMRHQITHRPGQAVLSGGEGKITLKLFNLVTREVGRSMLKNGVWIGPDLLFSFFDAQADDFFNNIMRLTVDGEPKPPNALKTFSGTGEPHFIRIDCAVST